MLQPSKRTVAEKPAVRTTPAACDDGRRAVCPGDGRADRQSGGQPAHEANAHPGMHMCVHTQGNLHVYMGTRHRACACGCGGRQARVSSPSEAHRGQRAEHCPGRPTGTSAMQAWRHRLPPATYTQAHPSRGMRCAHQRRGAVADATAFEVRGGRRAAHVRHASVLR